MFCIGFGLNSKVFTKPQITVLIGHHCCILGLASTKTIVIDLNKYKQTRPFFLHSKMTLRCNQTILRRRNVQNYCVHNTGKEEGTLENLQEQIT